ncbi:MAG: branched-chain amino acid ABC transporter permease [Alphaproteobacteria bacterium]|nr:branched-chain amino acid ABC transporter permease [Alphaproteobacteria bacterium]
MAAERLFGSWRERLWPVFVPVALIVVIVVLASFGSGSLQRTVTDGLIKLVIVVGLSMFIGNSGVVSFGHASFMAIGAYVSAWFTMPAALKRMRLPDLPAFIAQAQVSQLEAAVIAAGVAAAAAALIGVPLFRLAGVSASIGTFAVLAAIIAMIGNWDGLTGGKSSLIGVPVYTNLWIALGVAIAAIVVAHAFQRSRYGLRLQGSREDEVAAKAVGIGIYGLRILAFALSAFFVALAGVLHGHYLGILSADAFFLNITVITLAMLVIGGRNSLAGAVVGVIAVTTVTEVFRRIEAGFTIGDVVVAAPVGLTEVALAIFMLGILIFRPAGIMGGNEFTLPAQLGGKRHDRVVGAQG